MNFKKMMKRGQEGFTLVELIVVIAILGILGGIAVPAYSGYVEKTNKQADISLAAEVANAMVLHYYSNPANVTGGYVILNQEGGAEATGDDTGAAAMEAVFGDGWKTKTGLKYSDWAAENGAFSYSKSSFAGNEKRVVTTVNNLTGALSDFVGRDKNNAKIVFGEGFNTFLKDNYNLDVETGDPTKISNAAVLYVAQQTSGQKEFISQTMRDAANSGDFIGTAYNNLRGTIGEAAALATIYAYAEGFAQYSDKQNGNNNATSAFTPNFDNVANSGDAFAAINSAFGDLYRANGSSAEEWDAMVDSYMNETTGMAGADVDAFAEMMNTVTNNKDIVENKLGNADAFTDGEVENMLTEFKQVGETMQIGTNKGQIAVVLTVVDDLPRVSILPLAAEAK